MENEYLDVGGVITEVESLTIPRARLLADAVAQGTLDFVRFVECRRRDTDAGQGVEIIVVDLDVQRPQLTVHDIRRVERLAVVVNADDKKYPEVLSLRSDFPSVPHLNWRNQEFPRSLCLYDQSWEEVRTRWTAPAFIERIRGWLADTTTGTLHRDDQPLEPMLFDTAYRLILPADLLKGDCEAEKLDVFLVPSGKYAGTLIAEKLHSQGRQGKPQFIASTFVADTKQHGRIRQAPRSLAELCDFVKGETFDLLAELRERVQRWKDMACLNDRLIIVIAFPLARGNATEAEISDLWAFLTAKSVLEVGTAIGVWDVLRDRGRLVPGLIIPPDATRRGSDVDLEAVRPQFSFSRQGAANANGTEPVQGKMVAVGAGAIGSQVIMNLVRSGFGVWTVVDEDDLMPHNLARHVLPPWCVGMPKAIAVGQMIDALFEDEPPIEAIATNVLRPGEQKAALDIAMRDAELILDFAASVPVARHLARGVESTARRVSVFLNPRGTDLVCLGEDRERNATIDCLELQYYREVIRNESLRGHLDANSGRVRYARSCRDVSFSLSTHLVSLHASIGAHAVREASTAEKSIAKVWRADPETCAVTAIDLPAYGTHRAVLDDWTLVMDDWLIEELSRLRSGKLPNETGGVLIGSYDLPSKTVYVIDTVPSPPDSEEWPTLYIRGAEGLQPQVNRITEMTSGQLEYIGEWHSHPDQCSCLPSEDDLKVFSWMTDRMSAAGLPALMAIVGERNASLWFLSKMERNGGWKMQKG